MNGMRGRKLNAGADVKLDSTQGKLSVTALDSDKYTQSRESCLSKTPQTEGQIKACTPNLPWDYVFKTLTSARKHNDTKNKKTVVKWRQVGHQKHVRGDEQNAREYLNTSLKTENTSCSNLTTAHTQRDERITCLNARELSSSPLDTLLQHLLHIFSYTPLKKHFVISHILNSALLRPWIHLEKNTAN